LCLVDFDLQVGSQIFNLFIIKRLYFLKVPPGALSQVMLFGFKGLKFQFAHCRGINNIIIVKYAALTTYILYQKAPRGANSAMISIIPAGLESLHRTSILPDTISEAQLDGHPSGSS